MFKSYFIIRQDITMSNAKRCVQIGHGTDFIHMKAYQPNYQKWLDDDRRKIMLRIKSIEQLQKIEQTLVEHAINYDQIIDSGYTEFGSPTLTGIVIHPTDNTLPKPLQRLQLWSD